MRRFMKGGFYRKKTFKTCVMPSSFFLSEQVSHLVFSSCFGKAEGLSYVNAFIYQLFKSVLFRFLLLITCQAISFGSLLFEGI